MRTQRMTILVTPGEKAAIASRAEAMGVSSSEVVRLAFDAYMKADDMRELDALAGELERAVSGLREKLDRTHEHVQRNLAEMQAMREAAA